MANNGNLVGKRIKKAKLMKVGLIQGKYQSLQAKH